MSKSRRAPAAKLTRAEMKARVKDQADYAAFLAEDGAFLSAAKTLRTLADECEAHQRAMNASIDRLIAGARP